MTRLLDIPAYKSWQQMIRRCRHQPGYAGRVKICERWESFANFYADMGDRLPGMSLDRIDGTRGYEPGNVRWATASQQTRNTCITTFLEFQGKRMALADWAEAIGINYKTLRRRIQAKWTVEKALTTPVYTVGSRTRWLTFRSKTLTVLEWAKELGIKPATLRKRLEAHMPPEKAFSRGSLRDVTR